MRAHTREDFLLAADLKLCFIARRLVRQCCKAIVWRHTASENLPKLLENPTRAVAHDPPGLACLRVLRTGVVEGDPLTHRTFDFSRRNCPFHGGIFEGNRWV